MDDEININGGNCGCFSCALSVIGLILLYWLFFQGGIGKILELLSRL